jgi:hypothetical protein
VPAFFVQCPTHKVYLHQHGCILCGAHRAALKTPS